MYINHKRNNKLSHQTSKYNSVADPKFSIFNSKFTIYNSIEKVCGKINKTLVNSSTL